jgi:heterotetrameric sarcosine oxidase gamma subunit
VADLIARSPVRPVQPAVLDGWEVTGRPGGSALCLTDLTPLAKVVVRATFQGAMERALGVPFGRAARDGAGALVIGTGPGEWLVLGAVGAGPGHQRRLAETAARSAGRELVTILDLTHARALLRLTGAAAPLTLAKVCGVDLAEEMTPNGAAFRSSVARLVTDVIRDDEEGVSGPARSYLLACERSYGQYLFDVLMDAGAEFGIDIGGFTAPGI